MFSINLSIIIVNWNTKDLIKRCIQSIIHHTKNLAYEIIVVDNHSDDGSVSAVQDSFPSVILIQNEDNIGFARANNVGMKKALGEYLLLFNSDTYIDHNAFSEIIHYMDLHPEVGILSPKIVSPELIPYPMRLSRRTSLLSFLKIVNLYALYREYLPDISSQPIEAQVVGGSCMLIRKEVFDSVGYLEEGFFLYNEEDDFCRRALEKGWKIIFNPHNYIIHLHGMSTRKKEIYERVQIEGYKSDLFFFAKYYSRWISFLLKKAYQITFVLKMVKACVVIFKPSLRDASKNEIVLRWRMLGI